MNLTLKAPMTAKVCPKVIPQEGHIAEEKFDGYRELMVIGEAQCQMLSRTLKENSDLIPHLSNFAAPHMDGTVLDGELVSPTGEFLDLRGMCGVGTLPATAIQRQQEKGLVEYRTFDILAFRGRDMQQEPWYVRRVYLEYAVRLLDHPQITTAKAYATKDTIKEVLGLTAWLPLAKLPIIEVESFKGLCEDMWANGKEGIMLKDINGKYEQKRSKAILKLKAVKTYDVIIMGYQEPTKQYEGDHVDNWKYWESGDGKLHSTWGYPDVHDCTGWIPVTKPHAMGWVGAIIFGVLVERGGGFNELVKVGDALGINNADQEYIKANRDKLIGTVIEVKAQGIIDKATGSLRHPRFSRWREDKEASECTFEAHLEVG